MSLSYIEIAGLEKRFKEQVALDNIHLSVEQSEFLTLLGPSGCGKSTLLRTLAGFLDCDKGTISVAGRNIGHLAANQRDMGFVFQSYALFPNMNVFDNIAFGLKMRRTPKKEIEQRVVTILQTVGLADRAHYMVQELSGGQQQRVALARALAPQPGVLLLDEPLSALDAQIRLSMRDFIKRLQRSLGITTIFVTHDQEEALSMSDRIAVMREGNIVQIGSPHDLYYHPNSSFVAKFVGTTNLLTINKVENQRIYVPFPLEIGRPVDAEARFVSIRPEMIALQESWEPHALTGTIVNKNLLGSIVRYTVKVNDMDILVDTLHNQAQTDRLTEDMTVGIHIPDNACNLLR